MENLEVQQRIINLGKLFVKELKLEQRGDTLSHWMAHYLAEKISVAEQSEGNDKEAAEKECFDVILKLWQHRHSLPPGRRPFQNFEPILDTLSKLNPDTEESYFYNALRNQDLAELDIDNLDHKSVEEWANIAKEIDKTARVWIEYALSKAAHNAKNERTKEWLENAISLSDNADIGVINILLNSNPSFELENYDKEDFSNKYSIENLKKRIKQLQKFAKFNVLLLKAYQSELKAYLEKQDKKTS